MRTEEYLIQHKDVTKTHTIKVTELEELRRNAIDEELSPMYVIDTPKRKWVMVTHDEWLIIQAVMNYVAR